MLANKLILCPCGSGKTYQECCLPFISFQQWPITAEQLMRSRYVAYSEKNADYLKKSWAAETCPAEIDFDPTLVWTKLEILHTKKGKKGHQQGWVTFKASYQVQNGLQVSSAEMIEKSFFRKDGSGHWLYVDGEVSG